MPIRRNQYRHDVTQLFPCETLGGKRWLDYLVSASLHRQPRSIPILLVVAVGEPIERQGEVGFILFRLALRNVRPRVGDRERPQRVSKSIYLQRQCVARARIVRVSLVMVVDGFAGVGKEHRVAIAGPRL